MRFNNYLRPVTNAFANKHTVFLGLMTVGLILGSCARNSNTLLPRGGICGISTQPYENPYANENIDTNIFSILMSLTIPPADPLIGPVTYRAQDVNILFKQGEEILSAPGQRYKSDEQIIQVHRPVYIGEDISLLSFTNSCVRGLTDASTGNFSALLPTEISLSEDLSWAANQSVDYTIDYRPRQNDERFLMGTLEPMPAGPPEDSSAFGFVEQAFLEQIGNLSDAQKATKADPAKRLDEIFLQVQVSADPEIFARIRFLKVNEVVIESTSNQNAQ